MYLRKFDANAQLFRTFLTPCAVSGFMHSRRGLSLGAAAAFAAALVPYNVSASARAVQFQENDLKENVPKIHRSEPRAVSAEINMFHFEAGASVESVIRRGQSIGASFATVNELADMVLGDLEVPGYVICLSFDDGYEIQRGAVRALERHDVKGTFYVMSPAWKGDGVHTYFSNDLKKYLAETGHEIGCHTDNHEPNLVRLRQSNFGAYLGELFGSKARLEDLIQAEVFTFAYPNGVYNSIVAADVETAYKAAVTTVPGTLHTPENLFTMPRVRVN